MKRAMMSLAAVIAVGAALIPAPAGASPTPEVPAGPYTVALRTGDQVTVADPAATNLSVKPGPGRSGMRFAVLRTGSRVYVLPRDTLAQVGAGTVDRGQFDVTSLVRAQYRGVPQPRAEAPAPDPAETYQLTIRYLDRDGSPTRNAVGAVTGWDTSAEAWSSADETGTSTVRLPKGRYNLGAYLDAEADFTLLTQPVVDLTGDLTVTLDARLSKPVTVTVPEHSARIGTVAAGYSWYPSYQSWPSGMFVSGDDVWGLHIGQIGAPAAPEALIGSVTAQWAKPDGADDFTDSPYLYAVAETFPGRLPTGFTRAYRAGDFVAVHQQFAASAPARFALRTVSAAVTPKQGAVHSLVVPTTLPGTRVEYLQAGVPWASELLTSQRRLYQQPATYRPGRSYRDQWNTGPAGPAFGQQAEVGWQWASRIDDLIRVSLPLYGDRTGHPGSLASTDTARTALYRDGELVGESRWSGDGAFTVPPEPADYRLEVDDTRSADELSTRLSAAWTFRSGHADPVKLPLQAVRFTPALDADNAAPAGRAFTLPVSVEGQPGAPAPRT